MTWIIVIIVGLILIGALNSYLELPTCPECKSKKAEVVSKEEIKREPMYFKEKQRIKEYKNTSGKKQYFDWQTKVSTNKYYILECCNDLIMAFKTAIWENDKNDVRLDDGKQDIDSLDSQEYSTEPYMNALVSIN